MIKLAYTWGSQNEFVIVVVQIVVVEVVLMVVVTV